MPRRLIIATLLAAALACGCHRQPQAPIGDVVDLDTVPVPAATVQPEALQYNTFTGSFTCEIQGIQFNGQVRIHRDSAIWISANKLIELGRILLTPDSVQFYIKMNNSHLMTTYDQLAQQWGIDIDYPTMQALILGDSPSDITAANATRQTATEQIADLRRISSTDLHTAAPRQHIHVNYSRFEPLASQMFARRLDVNASCAVMSGSFALQYTTVTLDQPCSLPFSIPRLSHPITKPL